MKAAIYNPYLDTLGGGERYTLSFATTLIAKGYDVDLEWKNSEIIEKFESRFGISSKSINVIPSIKRGDGYDLCFWVSDGSIPSLLARKNILHFQVPFHNVNGKSLINKMKLFRIHKVVCNSEFTKRVIDSEYGVDSLVVYPPVDTYAIKSKRKENIILNVGRFSGLLQSKHQDILINSFKKLCNEGLKDWKLILIGGNEIGDGDYTEKIIKISQGFPIQIIKSPDYKIIKEFYGKAKLFWSASGFGENEINSPEMVEHFGITVVEAMAGGVVPLAYGAGGHREIIENEKSGYLWNSESVLEETSLKLINNKTLLHKMSVTAKIRSKLFSNEIFKKNVDGLI